MYRGAGSLLEDLQVGVEVYMMDLTNVSSHYYYLGEPIVNFRGVRSEFEYLFHFSMKFL